VQQTIEKYEPNRQGMMAVHPHVPTVCGRRAYGMATVLPGEGGSVFDYHSSNTLPFDPVKKGESQIYFRSDQRRSS